MHSKGIIGAVFDGKEQVGLLINWECNFQRFSFEVRAKAYWFEIKPKENKQYIIALYLDTTKSIKRYEGICVFKEKIKIGNEIINEDIEISGLGQLKYLEE